MSKKNKKKATSKKMAANSPGGTDKKYVRPIDHVVISLPDLDVARQRFVSLGFNVAPVATHNFGTQNALVPFENGTFLEPLTPGDSELVKEHRLAGNQFLVRDHAFRFRHGNEQFAGGLSMLALSGMAAKKDRKYFRKQGLRTGKIAVVKRPGLDIRASFALDERAPDCSLFICERKNGAPVFDDNLTNHANGAIGLASVTLVDDNPEDFREYLQIVSGQSDIAYESEGFRISLSNGDLNLLTPSGLKSRYGIEYPETSCREGMRLVTYDIMVRSLDEIALMLAQSNIEARQVGERIVVANAPGQGAMLAFIEENQS